MILFHYFSSGFKEIPVWESIALVLLILMTAYRRRLSSNDEYRKVSNHKMLFSFPILRTSTAIGTWTECCISPDHASLAGTLVDAFPIYSELHDPFNLSGISLDCLSIIVNFLGSHNDLVSLALTCRTLKTSVLSDFIWKQLWQSKYGDHLWRHPVIHQIRAKRDIKWDTDLNYGPPQQGWRLFYLQFEYNWIDWLLAGACTNDYCLVGLHGHLFDISSFLHIHPGSPEILTDGSGCDATVIFNDIGHSMHALRLLKNFVIWPTSVSPGETNHDDPAISIHQLINTPYDSGDERVLREGRVVLARVRADKLRRRRVNRFDNALEKERQQVLDIANRFNDLPGDRSKMQVDSDGMCPSEELSSINSSYVPYSSANMGSSNLDSAPNSRLAPISGMLGRSFSWSNYRRRMCFHCSGKPRVDHLFRRLIPSSASSNFYDCYSVRRQLPIPQNADTETFANSSSSSLLDNASDHLHDHLRHHQFKSPLQGIEPEILNDQKYDVRHVGQAKCFFDPLEQMWVVWWTCCGCGSFVSLED